MGPPGEDRCYVSSHANSAPVAVPPPEAPHSSVPVPPVPSDCICWYHSTYVADFGEDSTATLGIETQPGGDLLQIAQVHPGGDVDAFNEVCRQIGFPKDCVRPGDIIVSCNSIRGPAEVLMRALEEGI